MITMSDESKRSDQPQPTPGSRPTVYDVARHAGVSIKTVSRVANESSGVSPKTRRMVANAIRELGYVPNAAARSLVTGSSHTIGVVVDSISDPFFAALVSVAESRALAAGYSTQVASTGRDPQRERDQVLRMARENVRGLLLAPTMSDHDYLASALGDIPMVLVDRGWPDSGLDTVGVQDRSGTRTAIERLISYGHRRIAFLGDVSDLTTTRHRREGYLDALLAAGVPVVPDLVKSQLAIDDPGGTAVTELLELTDPPTAVFSSNARTSLGVVRALHRHSRTDIALIGFGDFDLADALEPGVTVVDHDPRQIAAAALDRLLARIRGQATAPIEIMVPVSLVTRGSGELPCAPS